MIRSEASDTIKRRLFYNRICPLCDGFIRDFHDFQYMTYRVGRSQHYAFFHTECLESRNLKCKKE